MLTLPALLLATVVIGLWRFDGRYGQDPYAYFDYGVVVLPHAILHGAGLTPMYWPLGYPALVALFALPLGPVPAAGQIVSIGSAGAAVLLTALYGFDVLIDAGIPQPAARRAAALGATLFDICGSTLQAAVMVTPEALAVATMLLSAWTLHRWMRSTAVGSAWLLASAIALGWCIVTRWGALAVAPLWILGLLTGARARGLHSLRPAVGAAAIVGAIVGTQFALAWTVPTSPWFHSRSFIGNSGLVSGGGWSLLHLAARSFANADGTLHYVLPNGPYYLIAPFLPKNLSPFAAPAVGLGLYRLLMQRRRVLLALVAPPGAILVLAAGLSEQDLRFVLPALPFIALLAGVGAASALDALGPVWQRVGWIPIVVLLLGVATVGLYDVHKVVIAARGNRAVASWAAARVPAGSTLITFELTETIAHSTRLRPVDLALVSPRDLGVLIRARRAFLLVRLRSMTGQWRHRLPGENFRVLGRQPGLVPLARLSGYTLYRVGSA
jgi:hypothetical protein